MNSMWIPLNTVEDLPALGVLESDILDFKRDPCDDSFEIAKDVAAFANTRGGTLLIGGAGRSSLVAWAPMDEAVARGAVQAYEQAVRDRCAPHPVAAASLIPLDGGVVIAFNVWPFPGQPVGVELKQAETSCGKGAKKIHEVYWYPHRVTTHTKSILPEQLPMFLDAKARRMGIAVSSAQGQQVVLIAAKPAGEKGYWMEQATIDQVDPLTGTISATVGARDERHLVAIPIDAVQMVSTTDTGTIIYLSGIVDIIADWAPDVDPNLRRIKAFFTPFY